MRVPRKQTLNPTRTELKGREEKRRTCHPGGESHAATAACARRADLLLRHSWRAEGDASTGALANNAGGEECCWLWRSPSKLTPVACTQTGNSAPGSPFSLSASASCATSDFKTATGEFPFKRACGDSTVESQTRFFEVSNSRGARGDLSGCHYSLIEVSCLTAGKDIGSGRKSSGKRFLGMRALERKSLQKERASERSPGRNPNMTSLDRRWIFNRTVRTPFLIFFKPI
jgi:hypothetical protein